MANESCTCVVVVESVFYLAIYAVIYRISVFQRSLLCGATILDSTKGSVASGDVSQQLTKNKKISNKNDFRRGVSGKSFLLTDLLWLT